MSKCGVFSGLYFPTFGLHTQYLSVFSQNTGKNRPEKTPYLDTLNAVNYYYLLEKYGLQVYQYGFDLNFCFKIQKNFFYKIYPVLQQLYCDAFCIIFLYYFLLSFLYYIFIWLFYCILLHNFFGFDFMTSLFNRERFVIADGSVLF